MVELDAVNYLLGVLGSAPVGSLANTNPDVAVAQKALTAAVVSVTSKGYWFNEVYNVDFAPDPVTSKIDTTGYTKLITRNIYGVVRGNFLFNPKLNTFEFTDTVTADAVAILDFDDLPESVQLAVQFFAGVQLCTTELEDTVKRGEMQEFYNNAYLQVKNEELEIKRLNRLTSPRVAGALSRVRPGRLSGSNGPNFGGRTG